MGTSGLVRAPQRPLSLYPNATRGAETLETMLTPRGTQLWPKETKTIILRTGDKLPVGQNALERRRMAMCSGPKGEMGTEREGIIFLHTGEEVCELQTLSKLQIPFSLYCRSPFTHTVGVTCWGTEVKYEGGGLESQEGERGGHSMLRGCTPPGS